MAIQRGDYFRIRQFARILGVNANLINKFHLILQVISSGFAVKIEKCRQFCLDTAELFVKLYPWYYIPTSVHKVFMHGAQIIKWARFQLENV